MAKPLPSTLTVSSTVSCTLLPHSHPSQRPHAQSALPPTSSLHLNETYSTFYTRRTMLLMWPRSRPKRRCVCVCVAVEPHSVSHTVRVWCLKPTSHARTVSLTLERTRARSRAHTWTCPCPQLCVHCVRDTARSLVTDRHVLSCVFSGCHSCHAIQHAQRE
jgi:hypothetical protein